MKDNIYIIKKEFYEEQYVLGIYDNKDKAEKIAQQFKVLEKCTNKDSIYSINIYEYELNKLQEDAVEDILNKLKNITETFGIPRKEE